MQPRLATSALLSAFLVTLAHGAALAATFAVDDTADRVDASPGDGTCATAAPVVCTLRAAVQEANALAGADTITIPAGTFLLSLEGAGEDAAATGDLDLTASVTITGNGAAGPNATIVSGNDKDRIFDILGSGNIAISALTVTNGFSGIGQLAGGIWNSATLVLSNVRVLDSEGRLGGGGINNDGTLTATDVTVDGCTSNSQGGGLYNAGIATLTGVTISRSHSSAIGGGIQNDGTLTLTNVTLSDNTAGTDGGALSNSVDATLTNVTIAQNAANRGAGIFSPGDLTVTNTIVATSTSGGNCNIQGSLSSGGSNIDSGTTCEFTGTGDLSGVDAGLGLLANYGGPTQTITLVAGSPAIDAATGCPPPATDQRGTARPQDGDGDTVAVCDIGAFESVGAPPASTTSTTTTGGSTTTTTIVGCDPAPRATCLTPGKGKLSIKEKVAGRERLSLGFKRFPMAVPQSRFGNPATGNTRVFVCLYDGSAQFLDDLTVDRSGQSGQTCGTPPKLCWKALPGKGYRYADSTAAADGVRKILAKGGIAKKAKITVQAGNDDRKQQTAMPTGLTTALQGSQAVTVQIFTSDAACFGITMNDVGTSTATSFKASGRAAAAP